MDSLPSLIDALYARLVLRDLFGKMLPGVVVVFAILSSCIGMDAAIQVCTQLSMQGTVLLLAGGWYGGLAVHWLGRRIGLMRSFPASGYNTSSEFAQFRLKFKDGATREQRLDWERLVVVSEASGTTSTGLALATLISMTDCLVDPNCALPLLTLRNILASAVPALAVTLLAYCLHGQDRHALEREGELIRHTLAALAQQYATGQVTSALPTATTPTTMSGGDER